MKTRILKKKIKRDCARLPQSMAYTGMRALFYLIKNSDKKIEKPQERLEKLETMLDGKQK